MGPFYHLLTLPERERALAEARRVLVPGGLLFATFLCRFTPLRFAAHNVPTGVYPGPGTDEFLDTGVMVLSGDPEAAATAMTKHVENVRGRAMADAPED